MNYTNEEFELAKQMIIMSFTQKNVTPVQNPHCYMIVGQPGAGKTTLANIFSQQLANNIVFISGDDYRRYHPHYRELVQEFGDNAVLHTQEFAGKMTESLINHLSKLKYNLIIEGTLRTTDVPIKTSQLLNANGYNVTLAAILVKPEVSYLSTIKRYHMMKEFGTIPRQTPKEHHDLVVRSIVHNLDFIYKLKNFSRIQIYNRQGSLLYDTTTSPNDNPSHLFMQEFKRLLSPAEKNIIYQEYGKYISISKITDILNDYNNFNLHIDDTPQINTRRN